MKNKYDVAIIGAGIIGAAIARELAKYDLDIVVLEANKRVAMETSTGNSGLVHGGFDPTPGKLNAKLNVLGKKRYEDWIKDMEFPYVRINSLVVAFNKEEMEHVHMLYERGLTNGLKKEEMEVLNGNQARDLEPNISKKIIGALLCNSSIAVDPVVLTQTLMSNAIKNDVKLKLDSRVKSLTKTNDYHIIKDAKGNEFQAKVVINVAGHYADIISKKAGHDEFDLMTRRGEYRILEKTEAGIVNSVIFMVPTIHGKGVIVAPTLDGHVLVGPTSEENVPKDETRLVTKKMFDKIGKIGKKLVPTIRMEKTCMTMSGSRPIEAISDDFWIKPTKTDKTFINVAGMKSPALSSAPAIADMVIDLVSDSIKLTKKAKWHQIEKNPLI